MGVLKNINEAFSIKNLTSMFNTGYQRVSPSKTKVITHNFMSNLSSKYNLSITNAFSDNKDPQMRLLANILGTIYTETHRTKKELFELYNSVKDLDQSSCIINDFIDDAFNTVDSEYPFTIEISDNVADKDKIEKILSDFVKKFDIYQLDKEINEAYLVYGDYYLYTIPKQGEGIVEIYDNVDIENVFSIYKNNKLVQHIGMNTSSMFANSPISGYSGQLIPIHPDLLAHFILNTRKIKLDIPHENASVFSMYENIKIGRSVLFDSLALLKKYQLLDMALTYKEVRNALMPILLGVNTGAFTTPDNMIEACKTIESYLQEGTAVSFDLQDQDTIEGLLQGASSVKVAPIPGDKGTLERLDIGQSSQDTEGLSKILDDTGHRIALTSGGVTSNEQGKSRLEILKDNSRRSKKLIEIQQGKAVGWRHIFWNHLRYLGEYIEEESIKVKYKNIPNSDIFEEANGLVTLLSVVNDLQNFATTMNDSSIPVEVDPDKMVAAFDLFVGNRYNVMKGFLRKTSEQSKQEISMMYDKDDEDKDDSGIKTSMSNSTTLTTMNKSFDGSSGASTAIGKN